MVKHSTVFAKPVWTYIEEREKEIEERSNYLDLVEEVLQEMWFSCACTEKFMAEREPDSSSELIVSTYFLRNIQYLLSSYELAKRGFLHPSYNILRTVIETTIKGYVCIVEEDISDMIFIDVVNELFEKVDLTTDINYKHYVSILKKIIDKNCLDGIYILNAKNILNKTVIKEHKDQIRKNIEKYSSYNKNIDILYTKKYERHWRRLYREICKTAHPSFTGTMSDLQIDIKLVNACLNNILGLCLINIFMFLEIFYNDIKGTELSGILKEKLMKMYSGMGDVPINPNKQKYKKKIQFKKDSYEQLLI